MTRPLILTVDEFLDTVFSIPVETILLLMYQNLTEIRELVDANATTLGDSYAFTDIQALDEPLYNRIRISLTPSHCRKLNVDIFLTPETE